MNKKVISTILISASFLIPLTGCFNAIPEMTEEEEKMVVRYMADAVIQNDVSYQSRLLDEEEKEAALAEEARKAEELKKIEEEQKLKEEKKKSEEDSASSSSTPTEVVEKVYSTSDMAGIFGFEGISFEYKGHETADVYYDNAEVFGYPASENSKLLVVSFIISNTSDQPIDLDFASSKMKYRIKINDEKRYTPDFVPIPDSIMNMFKDTIPAGGSVILDLVYQIPDDLEINKLDLQIINSEKDNFRVSLE